MRAWMETRSQSGPQVLEIIVSVEGLSQWVPRRSWCWRSETGAVPIESRHLAVGLAVGAQKVMVLEEWSARHPLILAVGAQKVMVLEG